MTKPEPIARNRYGLTFGRNRNPAAYHSGRAWASYYTRVCLRCGWSFRSPRHEEHRLADCDGIIAVSLGDPVAATYCLRNLFGDVRSPTEGRRATTRSTARSSTTRGRSRATR